PTPCRNWTSHLKNGPDRLHDKALFAGGPPRAIGWGWGGIAWPADARPQRGAGTPASRDPGPPGWPEAGGRKAGDTRLDARRPGVALPPRRQPAGRVRQ